MRPSPQNGPMVHIVVHVPGPYGLAWLPEPRSQASVPFLMRSPQYGASVQLGLQVPYEPLLTPLSHCSPGSLNPSPHLNLQWTSHVLPSVPLFAPSSHCSPGSLIPLPQEASGT